VARKTTVHKAGFPGEATSPGVARP
jgi:hypothetical protein